MEKKPKNKLFTASGAYRICRAYLGREPIFKEYHELTGFTEAAFYKVLREQKYALEGGLTDGELNTLEALLEVIERGDKV